MIDVALPVARALHFAAILVLEGSLAFQVWVLRPVFDGREPVGAGRGWQDVLAVLVAIVSGILWVGLIGADLAGTSFIGALSGGDDWLLLTHTLAGQIWIARLVTLVLLCLWLLFSRKQSSAKKENLAFFLSALLCGSLAWSGHGAATSGYAGVAHTAADFIHLLAAGFWAGGLLPFVSMLFRIRGGILDPASARSVTERFGNIAFLSVVALLLTGIVNTWMMLESVADLFGTLYGRLLISKIVLFFVMLFFAAANRFVLTPKMSSGTTASRAAARLVVHSATELVFSLFILGLVGVLGTLEPR